MDPIDDPNPNGVVGRGSGRSIRAIRITDRHERSRRMNVGNFRDAGFGQTCPVVLARCGLKRASEKSVEPKLATHAIGARLCESQKRWNGLRLGIRSRSAARSRVAAGHRPALEIGQLARAELLIADFSLLIVHLEIELGWSIADVRCCWAIDPLRYRSSTQ